MMRALISLVEGEGDEDALPTLLTKILHDLGQWNWYVGETIVVRSLGKLHKNLAQYMRHAVNKNNCSAILISLDLDDGCPKEEAIKLAERIAPLGLAQPVAIVFAYREYDAWFLASLPTIAGHHDLPKNLVYEGEVETKRDVKGWLTKQMNKGIGYNPILHQKKFSSLIDIEQGYERSRSFRRLYDGVADLLDVAEKGERGYVSPQLLPTVVQSHDKASGKSDSSPALLSASSHKPVRRQSGW